MRRGNKLYKRVSRIALVCLVVVVAAGCSSRQSGRANQASSKSLYGPSVLVNVNASKYEGFQINKDLIGVNGPGPQEAIANLKKIGVHWVRTDVSLDATTNGVLNYNCQTGSWNPESLDAKVAQIRQEGGTPLEIIDYTPKCLAANPNLSNWSRQAPDLGSNQAKWDSLISQVAEHEIKVQGVRYFEVWNEPDWVFFNGGLSEYLQLYKNTALAIEGVARSLGVKVYIGGPALADVLDTQDMNWLGPLLQFVSANRLPLDFITWHSYANDPYAGPISVGGPEFCLGRSNGPGSNPCYYNPNFNPDTIRNEVIQTENALKAYPNIKPLLIVDEWNLDGDYDPRQSQTYDAAYVASVLESVNSIGLNGMCFFNVNDSPNNPANNWGLLTAKFKPKPVYEAFRFWKMMQPYEASSAVTSIAGTKPGEQYAIANNFSNGQVGVLGSTDSKKSQPSKVSILLYNFKPYDLSGNYGTTDPTPYDRRIDLTVSGLKDSQYKIVRRLQDGNHLGTIVSSSTVQVKNGKLDLNFTLAGEGVELVELIGA